MNKEIKQIEKDEKVMKEIEKEFDGKEDYVKIRKEDIIIPQWSPRKMEKKSENDKDLESSIKDDGLLHPLTVREIKINNKINNGRKKYELLAGRRRFECSPGDSVFAKIVKIKSEYDARKLCAVENYQRKDIDEISRDDFFYQTFKIGKKNGNINSYIDMANGLNMNAVTLSKYIKAGEERAKYKNNDIISKASTSMLDETRMLVEIPRVRNLLIEMGQHKMINVNNYPELTKRIEACINKGMTEKMITRILDMSTDATDFDNSVKIDNNNVTGVVDGEIAKTAVTPVVTPATPIETSVIDKNKVTFNIDKFKTVSSVMAASPPDVREFIISKKIDINDAAKINEFESPDARKQIIEEKLKIEKWKKKSQETYDREWNNNVQIRKQQVQDIKDNGDTKLKTKFDIDLEQKLLRAKTANDQYDEDVFRRYRSLKDQLDRVILYHHPKKLKTDKGKEVVTGIIGTMYEILRLVLIETGKIRTGADENGENGRPFVDVEAKVTM